MAKIEFRHPDDTPFVQAVLPPVDQRPDWMREISDEEVAGAASRKLFGGPEDLEAFAVRFAPNTQLSQHAHVQDEIIVVTKGSIVFGNREYPVGSAVMIPGMTLYSFRAGPEGLEFLNFRAYQAAETYISKSQFMARRELAASQAAAQG